MTSHRNSGLPVQKAPDSLLPVQGRMEYLTLSSLIAVNREQSMQSPVQQVSNRKQLIPIDHHLPQSTYGIIWHHRLSHMNQHDLQYLHRIGKNQYSREETAYPMRLLFCSKENITAGYRSYLTGHLPRHTPACWYLLGRTNSRQRVWWWSSPSKWKTQICHDHHWWCDPNEMDIPSAEPG